MVRGGRGVVQSSRGRGAAAAAPTADEKQPFNPYQIPDAGRIKGGTRSKTAPRSGNRNMTFG